MASIRLITDEATSHIPSPDNKYLIQQKSYIVPPPVGKFLIVGFFKHTMGEPNAPEILKEAIKDNIGVIYLCDVLPKNIIINPHIIYITVQWRWLIHTLFHNPLQFRGVFGNTALEETVKAFSVFTKFNIPIIKSVNDVLDFSIQSEKVNKNFLLELTGGVGDHLLAIPTIKALNKKGYNVYILCEKQRLPCFDNLKYIKGFYHERTEIDVTKFDRIFWLHFGQVLNDYRLDLNKQNRIYSIAEVCGLNKDVDLVIKKPEIILTKEEVEAAKKRWSIYPKKIFFGFDSTRVDTAIHKEQAQKIITKLKADGFTVFVTSLREYNFQDCIDLTKKLTLREYFSLIYVMEYVLTIDSSSLHIAAAFNKKTTALIKDFPIDWRCSTYPSVRCFTPHIPCSPCIGLQFKAPEERKCFDGTSCYKFFDWDTILKSLTFELIDTKEPIFDAPDKKILICRWDEGMGDIIMLTAALKSLRAYYPGYEIVFGLRPEIEPVLKGNPYVDNIITDKNLVIPGEYEKIYDFTRFFEHEKYPMDEFPANGVCRIDLMYQDGLKIPAVDRRPIYYITEDEKLWAKNKIKEFKNTKYIVGFHIDAAGFNRNYPIFYFQEVAERLAEHNIGVILIGNKKGKYNNVDYSNIPGKNIINMVGLTLRETAAIINEVDLMVCVDSGILHLSAALKQKTIALFGNIKPLLRILYYDTVDELYPAGEIECVPCNDAIYLKKCLQPCLDLSSHTQPAMCMWRLTPNRVINKILMDLGLLSLRKEQYRPKLSFALMTHNEENWIGTCLDHINDVADEIVILDDSTDKTRKIISKYDKVRIIDYKDIPCPKECKDYCKEHKINLKEIGRPCSAKLRMISFKACTGNWIFRIDADEIIMKDDAKKLRYLVDYSDTLFPQVDIFWFSTVNFFLDDKHYKTGLQNHVWFPDVHKRLHKNKEEYHSWTQPAHERMTAINKYWKPDFIDDTWYFPQMHFSNWFNIYHYGYLQPRVERIIDADKYKKMDVLLHIVDGKNIEEWVWKKPKKVKLPKGWGSGIIEYSEGEEG